MFSELSSEPLGAASLAQCHRGVLRDSGEVVAVKIQHPDVHRNAFTDLESIQVISNFCIYLSFFLPPSPYSHHPSLPVCLPCSFSYHMQTSFLPSLCVSFLIQMPISHTLSLSILISVSYTLVSHVISISFPFFSSHTQPPISHCCTLIQVSCVMCTLAIS